VPQPTPHEAFDALYNTHADALYCQAYLLTGQRRIARETVGRAFQSAWQHWPDVAVGRDPAGWVRAAAYDYALSPWHRLRLRHRRADHVPAPSGDRELLKTLLGLPPVHRRVLLLHDLIGLDLPDIAAEMEASTSATVSRLFHARQALAGRFPALDGDPQVLRYRLSLLPPHPLQLPPAWLVRAQAERRARLWTRVAIGLSVLILGATAFTLLTAPSEYRPPQDPGRPGGIVPGPRPGGLTAEQTEPADGPEQVSPLSR
jgi:DNA-directed RNA polymerase specialized sigma24 family protein